MQLTFVIYHCIALQPGMSSEFLIREGTAEEYVEEYGDVETRFPIPNHTELRKDSIHTPSNEAALRKIQFKGDGSTSTTPSDLPFSPPGLMWNGQPAITTSSLIASSRKKQKARRGRL